MTGELAIVFCAEEVARLRVAGEAVAEWERARKKNPAMDRPHYGYAVLLEEVDELWDAIKAWPKKATIEEMRAEAIQVAAMALAFVHEVCDSEGNK